MSAIRSKCLVSVACWVFVGLTICGVAVGPNFAQEQKEGKKDEKKDEKKTLELKPERKIEFSTDEGTWLSLDVSPDGKTIVFELLGDIYTLPVDGGQANDRPGQVSSRRHPQYQHGSLGHEERRAL